MCFDLPRQVFGCEALRPRGWGFLYQRFSLLLRNEACLFRNQQSRTWSNWATIVLSGTRGPSLFLVIRESLESRERLRCPRHRAPDESAETRSRTRVSREPAGHRHRNPQRWSGSVPRHSSCLWFQMLGVEAHSFLPHDQHDGGNLSGQGQTRHLRAHALAQQSAVELLERTRFRPGHDRRTFKQVLQIVIAVAVQSANRACFFARCSCPWTLR